MQFRLILLITFTFSLFSVIYNARIRYSFHAFIAYCIFVFCLSFCYRYAVHEAKKIKYMKFVNYFKIKIDWRMHVGRFARGRPSASQAPDCSCAALLVLVERQSPGGPRRADLCVSHWLWLGRWTVARARLRASVSAAACTTTTYVCI